MFKVLSPILYYLAIAFAIIAMSACSFKKNPSQNNSQRDSIASGNGAALVTFSTEELFNEKDEDKIIAELVENFAKYEQYASQSNESVLDAAIKYEKYEVVNYLIIDRGLSPFEISQNTYNTLTFKQSYSDFIGAHQSDRLIAILNNKNHLRDEVNANKLGQVGCQRFAEFLIKEKYNHKKSKDDSTYWGILKTLNIDETFKAVLTETDCSNYTKSFSTNVIKSWMTAEFLFQFQHNFKSPNFLKYLSTLNTDIQNNAITFIIPAINRAYAGLGTINIEFEPKTAFELKRRCMKNRVFVDEDIWRELIYKYGFTIEESSLENSGFVNPRSIYHLFELVSNLTLSKDEFADEYLKVGTDSTSTRSTQFVNEICGAGNE